jgi:glycosyltransferase involved in cell wall biosynthesis
MYEKNDNLKICFLSLNSYHLLTGRGLAHTGGAEVQQVELAKELQKKGFKIYFITYTTDHNRNEMVNGINIVPVYDRKESNKLSFLNKFLMIWKKLKEVDADIYFYRAGSPGISSIFCKLNKKKLIKSIASNIEMTGEPLIKKNWYMNYLLKIANWLDIKLSDKVISQSEFQKSELTKRLKINSEMIRNAFTIPKKENIDREPIYLLWVGTIYPIKQPSLFLKIPTHFPDKKFLMIGRIEDLELYEKIKKTLMNIPNLEFKGFIPHNKIFNIYKKTILLINTSKTEGFPNIFLEAWSYSIPVISLNIDPDGIISKYKLGYCSKNFDQMLENIKTLLEDKELLRIMGENGRKYVEENHDIKKIVDQYENLIKNLVKKTKKKV